MWESIGSLTFAEASWWSWNWDSSIWCLWDETQTSTCSCLGSSHTPPHTDVPSKDCQHFWGNVWAVLGWHCEGKQETEQGLLKKDNDLLHDIGWLFHKSIFFSAWVCTKCLPSVQTLRNYRKRVDGSPGFSTTAMNMIKQKVTEMHNESKQLFLSVSCDDMSIRYIFLHIKGAASRDFWPIFFINGTHLVPWKIHFCDDI